MFLFDPAVVTVPNLMYLNLLIRVLPSASMSILSMATDMPLTDTIRLLCYVSLVLCEPVLKTGLFFLRHRPSQPVRVVSFRLVPIL